MSVKTFIRQTVLSRAKRLVKDVVLDALLPGFYKLNQHGHPNMNKVLFLTTKEDDMPDAFKLIYEELDERHFEVEFFSMEQGHSRFLHYIPRWFKFTKKAAGAGYIFLEDASDVVSCLPLHPSVKVAQLWHGCGAFKKWGMSTADLLFGGSREEILRHPFYKNLSLVTISSPEVAWAYEEAMVLGDTPEIIKPIGVSRTDVLFSEKFQKRSNRRLAKLFPPAEHKKVILYAPTFRGTVRSAHGPGYLDMLSLHQLFGEDYVLVVKHHPFVKKNREVPPALEDFLYYVQDEITINELLCCADVCISDYSSLVFEYSLFEKPMAFLAFDREKYDDWRGFYYDYDELTPGPVLRTNIELFDWLLHLEERFDVEQVRAFKERFMSACDGHSTERILADVFGESLNVSPHERKAAH